jgi:hypothetical protein
MRSRSRRAAIAGALTALALAATASTAAGQTIELVDEETFDHCPAVSESEGIVSGGCEIHLLTDQPLTFYSHPPGGAEFFGAGCQLEVVLRLDEQGVGYVADAAFAPAPPASCNWTPCPTHVPLPWSTDLQEVGGDAKLEFDLCVYEFWSGAVLTCPFDGTVSDLGSHVYRVTHSSTNCTVFAGGMHYPYPVELHSGRLQTEAAGEPYDTVELIHL